MDDTDARQHELDLQRWDDDGGAQVPAPLDNPDPNVTRIDAPGGDEELGNQRLRRVRGHVI
jgi:hypothetical protein